MYFQVVLTFSLLISPGIDALPRDGTMYFWLPAGMALIWIRPAFVYGLPLGALSAFYYSSLMQDAGNDDASNLSLLMGFGLLIAFPFVFQHEKAIREVWPSAFIFSAMCWATWLAQALAVIIYVLPQFEWPFWISVTVASMASYHLVLALKTRQPQTTFCILADRNGSVR